MRSEEKEIQNAECEWNGGRVNLQFSERLRRRSHDLRDE